ncbi:MAG: energy-coupling factor transporter transmembrane protein EcfT, partial [Planctomycetes bacterium]|nr:energy-coupling factor transporter transmembrane protein EcfT [Planctomycetota bacterium]
MRLYLYVEKLTPIHRLDPRTKLFLMLGSFVLALLFGHPLFVLAVAAVILVHAWSGGALGNVARAWPLFLTITFFSV